MNVTALPIYDAFIWIVAMKNSTIQNPDSGMACCASSPFAGREVIIYYYETIESFNLRRKFSDDYTYE